MVNGRETVYFKGQEFKIKGVKHIGKTDQLTRRFAGAKAVVYIDNLTK